MQRVAPYAIALFAVALYAVTLGGTFVYDDVGVILIDPRIADPHAWGGYWTASYNGGVDNLYRPLVSMTYAFQYWLHAKTSWPYHAVNVVLHALASAAFGWMAMRLAASVTTSDGVRIGWIAGLLFAAHPVHVEAVANVIGRAELMCALLTFLALGLAIGPLTGRRVFGVWLCCALAILCKEQGILAALLVGVVRFAIAGGRQSLPLGGTEGTATASRSDALQATLFALLTLNVATVVILRENVIHLKFWWDRGFLDEWMQPLATSGGVDRWLVPVTIAGRYLGLLVAPVTLRIDYGGVIVPGVLHVGDPYFWLGVGAVGLWFGLLGYAWRAGDRLVGVGLAGFAITYAMVSNWPTLIGVNVAERLMYVPSAFFILIVASLVARLPRSMVIGVVALVTLSFSVRTVSYAWRWNDRLTFYEYAARVEPRSMKATLLAMREHQDRGELQDAERYARHATEIDADYDDAWLRLAGVLMDRGKFDEAQLAINRAREIRITPLIGTYERKLAEKRAAASVPSSGTP